MTPEESRTRAAYQESGHAVMAYLVGEKDRIAKITIKPDIAANAAGTIFFNPPFPYQMEGELAYRVARIFLAGLNAEYFACQRHNAKSEDQWDPNATFGRTQSDADVIGLAFERLNLSEEEQLAVNAEVTQMIVKPENRYAIEKLTEALLADETLTGDDARAIIEDALNSFPDNQQQ